MNKFVSFISPMYNINKYLPDFLESFIKLPKHQYELILVDDCGVQRPEKIIKQFEGKVNYKLVKNSKNLGLGFARNIGLKNISKKSTHFMFIDPDDILDTNAWSQINNAKAEITLSSKFVVFTKTKKNVEKIWRNTFYKGAGVSPAWGHLISSKFKNIEFSSQFFEDQRYMAKLTSDHKYEWFSEPIINYRNRKSSILNEKNNSKRKAKHIFQFVEELSKSKNNDLIENNRSFKFALIFAKVEFLYISKENRNNVKLNNDNYSSVMNIIAIVLAFFEKITFFWWFYNKFSKGDFYE